MCSLSTVRLLCVALWAMALLAWVLTTLTCRCIIDHKQRVFDAESCRLLCNFAEVVVREIEKNDARVRASARLLGMTFHVPSYESKAVLVVEPCAELTARLLCC